MPTQKKQSREVKSILDVVRDCDDVVMATVRPGGMPDARHLANMMNRDASDLNLFFMTSRHSPKMAQITANPYCCLYYYNDATHYSVRLYGKLELVTDDAVRRAHWDDGFLKFGYSGVDDPEFVLMRFAPTEYKYYDADGLETDKLKHD